MLKMRYAGKLFVLLVGILLLGLLTACGQNDEIQSTNLKIGKEGTVTSTIVEDFDKDYYTVEGLEAMIQEEISAYNAGKADAISLISVEVQDNMENKIIVNMKFASAEDYANFNKEDFFYGTVSQAIEAGYEIPQKLYSASDMTKTIRKEEINAMSGKHILIIAESTKVLLPQKAVYISEGVDLINHKEINVEYTDDPAYVIME